MRQCTCEYGGTDAGDAGALAKRQAGDVGQARPCRRDAAVRQLPLVRHHQPPQPPQRPQRLDPLVRQLPACPLLACPITDMPITGAPLCAGISIVCNSCSNAWRARLRNAASSADFAFHTTSSVQEICWSHLHLLPSCNLHTMFSVQQICCPHLQLPDGLRQTSALS